LSKNFAYPLYHVDSIQYLPGLKVRNKKETQKILNEIAQISQWIIDGLGPMETITAVLNWPI